MSVVKPGPNDLINETLVKKEKDKIAYLLNIFTGELDMVLKFNANRIVTHQRNMAGSLNTSFDPVSGQHIEMGPLVVTDNDGNVVTI